jgi:hypothetical protein
MSTLPVLLALGCIAVVVVIAGILLALTLVKPDNRATLFLQKGLGSLPGWVWPLLAAMLIALFTLGGALFFLSVVALLNLKPGQDASYTVGVQDKQTAGRIYTWLFLSPLLTVPCLGFTFVSPSIYADSFQGQSLSLLLPVILHAPLLLGLTSRNTFVFRHTQQGILLMAIRAASTLLLFGLLGDELNSAFGLFMLVNGGLWLFSSLWGWSQTRAGECWWLTRKGEVIQQPGASVSPTEAATHLNTSREFIRQFKKNEALEHALVAFRTGNRETRIEALQLLVALEEVEQF